METEQRIDELERSTMETMLMGMALDSVVRALIATHPNQDYFRVVFSSLIERQIALAADHGFEKARPEHQVQWLAEGLRKQAQSWLHVLHGRPSADESGHPAS